MSGPASQIALTRPAELFGTARKLRVFIDGEEAGRVGCDRRERLPVEPGTHRVTVAMDWCRSQPLTVKVEPEQTVDLWARAHYHRPLLNCLGLILWPNDFFALWRAEAPPDTEPTAEPPTDPASAIQRAHHAA